MFTTLKHVEDLTQFGPEEEVISQAIIESINP
jgi:hypothetical protein